ncbi:MAG: flagellar hook-length control protein FliK [Bryobacteraceae bacterium]
MLVSSHHPLLVKQFASPPVPKGVAAEPAEQGSQVDNEAPVTFTSALDSFADPEREAVIEEEKPVVEPKQEPDASYLGTTIAALLQNYDPAKPFTFNLGGKAEAAVEVPAAVGTAPIPASTPVSLNDPSITLQLCIHVAERPAAVSTVSTESPQNTSVVGEATARAGVEASRKEVVAFEGEIIPSAPRRAFTKDDAAARPLQQSPLAPKVEPEARVAAEVETTGEVPESDRFLRSSETEPDQDHDAATPPSQNSASIPVVVQSAAMARNGSGGKAAVEGSPTVQAPQLEEEPPLAPLRQLTLQATVPESNERVDVKLTERAGALHVTVRSSAPELVQALREQLPELSTRLERSGFRSELAHEPANLADAFKTDSFDHKQSNANNGQQDRQSGMQAWQEESQGRRKHQQQQVSNWEEKIWQ